jgi:hypothetical protein
MTQSITLYFQYKSMKEDGFQAFITAEVNAEDPDEVGTTEDYIDSIVQAKVNVDSDIMAVYVTRTDTDDTTSRGSGLDNITPLFKVDK